MRLFQHDGLDHKHFAFVGARVSAQIWHSRLGYTAFRTLSKVLSNKAVPLAGRSSVSFCHSCPLGKSTKLPFVLSDSVSNKPLHLIHSDVWSCSTLSVQGHKYYVLFVDDYSRYSWIFPMKRKSEVLQIFIQFRIYVEKQFSCQIKQFQSDEGGEYTSHAFRDYLNLNGIHHRFSCPKHP